MNYVIESVFICRNEDFRQWVQKRLQGCWGPIDEPMAANFIRAHCRVKSRSELNTNVEALSRFKMLLTEFQRDRALSAVA